MCRAFFVCLRLHRSQFVHNLRSARRVYEFDVWDRCQPSGMGDVLPFVGTEALASGAVTRYELRRYYRPIMPNVYLDKRVEPSLRQRTLGAWLWTGRDAVV